jgi:hypothetical protein
MHATLGTVVMQAGLGGLLWWIIVILVILAVLGFIFGRR